ncbi:substrate-binding domain-containing protein [Nonomuraea endophytica]|uniref:DNA-binding LacI/PurR family transcriptional regulator/AcrR family transcriptional regulator n=1 Tax=Nonomuraea endophytica TaxID=714136 RepID=A0A7W8EJN9_9ACTN|nr:substrate-binding domain-containing protein [Nonomuraea endophytica]MBB5081773.1 DNA-binding LacI/PurR family transcriptional regulator/AcrR family transcriptional regulator [Nonomuraea endophytica]
MPPARRERKKADTRQAIVREAWRLFAERGFDVVRVTEIAEAADVSAKTVFNHFATKEQLFFHGFPLLTEALRERPAGEPIARAIHRVMPSLLLDADRARLYLGSRALRTHALELFAAQEPELAVMIAAETRGSASSSATRARHSASSASPAARLAAAALLARLRTVWESALETAAAGAAPRFGAELDLALEPLTSLGAHRGAGASARHKGAERQREGAPEQPQPDGETRAVGRPSISRVAALAGVSATTVSHTLNGRRPVAERTRGRVLAAIEELGYRPNVLARGLRTSRSQTVGLVIPDLTNPFYPALARGVQDVLGAAGYDQIISNTDGERAMERAALEQMIARQVDALAFAVFNTHPEDLLPVLDAGIPVVRLGGRLTQPGVDIVRSDDEGAAATATRYLLERGHRRIAFVCGPAGEGPAAERVAGHLAALAEAGLPGDPKLVIHTQFSRTGGEQGTALLLDSPQPPDAVLCANDIMAIGALDAAAARGLRVPEDLAVMGFDDIEAAGLVSPGLTTMANPAREIGMACARLLLNRLSGTAEPYTEIVVPARLVRRTSA